MLSRTDRPNAEPLTRWTEVHSPVPLRWIAVTVFVFSAVLNYLDRQVLATDVLQLAEWADW
jgi:hypothetical protein